MAAYSGLNRVGPETSDFSLDGNAELGDVVVPITRRNCCSQSSIPAPVQQRHISPFCQSLTLREERRTHWIIDAHGLVDSSVVSSSPVARR